MNATASVERAKPSAMDSAAGIEIAAATYNIHRCVGTDGRYSPGRIAEVISELEADIVGLQEVDRRLTAGPGGDQLSYIADRLGYHVAAEDSGQAASLSGGWRNRRCHNAILSRWPIRSCRLLDLAVPGREPRSAIDTKIAIANAHDTALLNVVVTHFGLRAGERRRQLQELLGQLDKTGDQDSPLLLMGDLNEWRRAGPISRGLDAALMCGQSVRSFPSRYPVFPLDRICGRSLVMVTEPHRHTSKMARVASDHLPIRAVFRLSSLR